jgi:hypothetical protein
MCAPAVNHQTNVQVDLGLTPTGFESCERLSGAGEPCHQALSAPPAMGPTSVARVAAAHVGLDGS